MRPPVTQAPLIIGDNSINNAGPVVSGYDENYPGGVQNNNYYQQQPQGVIQYAPPAATGYEHAKPGNSERIIGFLFGNGKKLKSLIFYFA